MGVGVGVGVCVHGGGWVGRCVRVCVCVCVCVCRYLFYVVFSKILPYITHSTPAIALHDLR